MAVSVGPLDFYDIDPAVRKVVGSTPTLTESFNRYLILGIQCRLRSVRREVWRCGIIGHILRQIKASPESKNKQ